GPAAGVLPCVPDPAPRAIDTLSLPDALPILLGGTVTLPGRTIDTDLRWKLVISLAVLGGIDAAGIDEQLAADDTQSGRKLLVDRSEEHTSELQSRENLVCRLLLEKKKQRPPG